MSQRIALIRLPALALCATLALLPGYGHAAPVDGRQGRVTGAASAPPLSTVSFVDGQHGWVAGTGIFATSNGGHTWRRQYSGTTSIAGIEFSNRQLGWAVGAPTGNPVLLLRTTDGGQHWLKVTGPVLSTGKASIPLRLLQGLQFLSATRGFGIASPQPFGRSNGTLVQTTDGGATWKPVRTPLPVTSTCFADAQHGWSVAMVGDTVLKTTNGGRTWTRSFTPGAQFVYGGQVGCIGRADAWALLFGGVGMNQQSYSLYHTADAGVHWKPVVAASTAGGGPAPGNPAKVPQGIAGYGAQLRVVNAATAYLLGGCPPCGGTGTTLLGSTHDGGASWQNLPAVPGMGFTINRGISFPTPQQGWLVSSVPGAGGANQQGVILTTGNGGRTWVKQGLS